MREDKWIINVHIYMYAHAYAYLCTKTYAYTSIYTHIPTCRIGDTRKR